ncbi:hypothetical protein BU23DRAFT_574885 [Bimuria novae-zelandiae CBS 107.79]|uniref:Uncharacterized protein n=1 Tax=Bimuria novae-zelandiae CBS 107.79 TaxID=1447943 RepID=A0A6A5UJP5_9PLEO|nr:hypothetical protein BU23DRAFT_574885 [Bimuria novae-zelandiae CBS 107.79]
MCKEDDSPPAAAPISSSARKRTIKQHLRAKQNRIRGITTTPTEIGADGLHLKEVLDENPDTKFGFVIYRCAYDSQEKWDRFVSHLTEQTFLNLREEGAEELFWRIDWCVQKDAKGLKNASVEKVRRRFKKWVKEHGDGSDWPRYQACVKVD